MLYYGTGHNRLKDIHKYFYNQEKENSNEPVQIVA